MDRPAWSALRGGWAHLAQGDERALRVEPDHDPFVAPADFTPGNIEALRSLPGADGELWLVEKAPLPPLSGLVILREADVAQMVAEAITPGERAGNAGARRADPAPSSRKHTASAASSA